VAWLCHQIREKYGIIPCGYPYQVYLFVGFHLVNTLPNAFSKKVENLECDVALHFMHYNFARIHKTLRVTPAIEAAIADHV